MNAELHNRELLGDQWDARASAARFDLGVAVSAYLRELRSCGPTSYTPACWRAGSAVLDACADLVECNIEPIAEIHDAVRSNVVRWNMTGARDRIVEVA